ncbi:hypothetical protein B0J11DRAFT_130997 [Dendryphion nanum]|uniref:C2H2-type domain-containing protein n=1 Tax=Dendryphion nanum TaxID=256645 RepID=A0A9P9ICA2_9PLEO|nr:hypothetical protein B0J11DRAFT_130997 [Dendryphion nanum]
MDGKNASGRRISLLNDSAVPRALPIRLPSISPSLRSRTSSYISSPIGSPPTPQLVRSNSSDSTTMQTPSPITPDFYFEGMPSANMPSPVFGQPFFNMPPSQKELNSQYPPVPQASVPLPYHPAAASQASYIRTHQQSLQQQQQPPPQSAPEPRTQATGSNGRSKKNSYPCPMAKQYRCNDYFTTSGHAARHAKKHTGKKDAFCPECNKAFTRKDNMEQHRRTHQSGRNAAKGSENAAKKVNKQQAKRPKPSPLQTSNLISMPVPALNNTIVVDPVLSADPATFSMPPTDSYTPTYPDPTPYSMTSAYPTGSSYGLDALAIAASGEKRKYDA